VANTRGEYFSINGSKLALLPRKTAAMSSASVWSIIDQVGGNQRASPNTRANSVAKPAIEALNSRRLLKQSNHHALGHVRLGAEQLDGSRDERRALLMSCRIVEWRLILDLLGAQAELVGWATHAQRCPEVGQRRKG